MAIPPIQILMAGGPRPPEIVFAYGAGITTSQVVSLGGADPKRIVVVSVPSGIVPTLDGNAMTLEANLAGGHAFYAIAAPTGSSGTVAVSSAVELVGVYVLYGMSGITPFATGTGSNSANVNVPVNGAVIAAFNSNNVVSFTAGVTADATNSSGAGVPAFKTVGHAGIFATAQTPLVVSGTGGGGASQRMVAASWGP